MGSDAGDIDNDGDVDVLTTEFTGTICHFNDGKETLKQKNLLH